MAGQYYGGPANRVTIYNGEIKKTYPNPSLKGGASWRVNPYLMGKANRLANPYLEGGAI